MKVQYKRVSSIQQNLDRQDLEGMDRVFEEKDSGASKDRPALLEMLQFVRAGDVIYCHSIDRLSRSLKDLTSILEELKAKGVTIKFLTENLTFSSDKDDPFATLQLQMLGALSQWELSCIKIRQAEGIAKAKANGKYQGRKKQLQTTRIAKLREEGYGATKIAEIVGCSRQSVYRELRTLVA